MPPKMNERTAHVLDLIKDENHKGNDCLREFLLHSRSIHIILVVLLFIDGSICLACGVLESNYLQGSRDDCTKYVDRCVEKVHHRRLYDSPYDVDFRQPAGLEVGLPGLSALMEKVPLLSRWQQQARFLSAVATNTHWSPAPENKAMCDAVHLDTLYDIKHSFGNHDLHTAELTLTYISIGILAVFLLEQFLLIYELRSEYCKAMFLLDLFIISSSILIEVCVVFGLGGPTATAGLLVIARAWRFARVGHGVFETTEHIAEFMEEDEVYETMKGAWAKLDDNRWREIRRAHKKEVAEEIDEEELAVAEHVSNNPVAILRALSYAKAWKDHHDKKKRRKKGAQAVQNGQNGVQATTVGDSNTVKL